MFFIHSIIRKGMIILLLTGIFLSVMCFSGCSGQSVQAEQGPQYQIGVCDWMILKRQKLEAFQLASEIGADGIELDMGSLGDRIQFESQLDEPLGQRKFLEEAQKYNQKIASIAMSGFYAQDFARRPEYKELTEQAIRTAKAMGVNIIFLPLGIECNPKAHPDLREILVERLRVVGELAAKEDIVIGICSKLPSDEEVRFLDEIGSKGIKAFVNFSDVIENGEDIPTALKNWGKENIIQIHCSNTDGYWIRNDPKIDMPAVKQVLDEMGWSGWLVIERSRDPEIVREVKINYTENVAYMKSIFQPADASSSLE